MGIIDDFLNKQRIIQEEIFKRFGTVMKENTHLILPERFREKIGDIHERIHFSKYIDSDKGYVIEKPIEKIKFEAFLPKLYNKKDIE